VKLLQSNTGSNQSDYEGVIMAIGIVCKSGIYKIKHTASGKLYVGSAVLLSRRLARHKTDLKGGVHDNCKLQRAWDKHGSDAFEFTVIEYVDVLENLVEREQYWMDSMRAVENGYNLCPVAGSCLGTKKSAESIARSANAHRGMKRSEETKALIRAARARQAPMSIEGRARISAALATRIVSDETRTKLSKANKGRKMSDAACEANRQGHIGLRRSPESIAKTTAARLGSKHTDESKRKMSAWQIGRKMSPEAILRRLESRKNGAGFAHSAESKKNISLATKGKPKSQQMKDRLSLALKGRVPCAACIEASRKAHIGMKYSPEVIAKRIAARARKRAEREQQTQAA